MEADFISCGEGKFFIVHSNGETVVERVGCVFEEVV